jgi:hypothetical protein
VVSAEQVAPPKTNRSVPFITIADCSGMIARNWLEIAVLIFIVLLMTLASFLVPTKVGLDNVFPKLADIATGALCSLSSFPLKPAYDRFTRILLLRQARQTLEGNEPLSEMLQAELRMLTHKRGVLR